jgi:predicted nucleic acid-binding protein
VASVLLDSSFLIDLEREIESGSAGPAIGWLRRNRTGRARALLVSCVSAAEFLEGFADQARGMEFLDHYIPQGMGFQHSIRCAEIQRRAKKKGRRLGENDAWQIAFADRAGASVVGRDRRAFETLGSRYEQY